MHTMAAFCMLVAVYCGRFLPLPPSGGGGYSGPGTYGHAEKPKGHYWKFRHETNPAY